MTFAAVEKWEQGSEHDDDLRIPARAHDHASSFRPYLSYQQKHSPKCSMDLPSFYLWGHFLQLEGSLAEGGVYLDSLDHGCKHFEEKWDHVHIVGMGTGDEGHREIFEIVPSHLFQDVEAHRSNVHLRRTSNQRAREDDNVNNVLAEGEEEGLLVRNHLDCKRDGHFHNRTDRAVDDRRPTSSHADSVAELWQLELQPTSCFLLSSYPAVWCLRSGQIA